MGLRGKSVFQAAPRCHGGTRVGGVGFSHSGLLAVCAVDVKPVRAPCSGTHGRNGSESPFARCGSDISSAAAVRGLCGVLCRLCVCDCGAPCRAIGFDVGTLVAPLGNGGVVVSDLGDRFGQLVGLLRTRLGWSVLLGSSCNCLLCPLVGGYCTHSLFSGFLKPVRFEV